MSRSQMSLTFPGRMDGHVCTVRRGKGTLTAALLRGTDLEEDPSWCGQASVDAIAPISSLLMGTSMLNDTVMKFWIQPSGRSCRIIWITVSSKTMRGPIQPGGRELSLRKMTSTFCHGQLTARTCLPLNTYGMRWRGGFGSCPDNPLPRANWRMPFSEFMPASHRSSSENS